jgi:4-methyl-5(b-hydroxyethyl)-thiazole monophosphate biosynthesis
MEGAEYTAAIVESDGQFITGRGPAAAFEFGYTLVDRILGEGASQPLREGMIYAQLLA